MISASEVIVEELLEQENISAPHISSVSTIEEIYYTGFMEGAQISIQDAMDFLQSGAEPSSVEELILMNSRQAAGFAAENMYHAIDSNYLHNLAYFLTEGLDNGGGDFRIADTIEIPSLQGEKVKLPPADMIHEQAEQFSLFLADMKTHPLIKSAAAQAWVLAVRPFPEGNERLARLLSNVILVRSGYRFFGNISISSMIARTSYDYFRAIANILRSENGADLTYFMEYYMTVLSGAINELRHRRDKRQKEIVEKEQQMAVTTLSQPHEPISETIGQQNVSLEQNNRSNNSYDCGLKSVIDAMNELMIRGVSEFKSYDIRSMTGLNRQHVNRILYKLEFKNLLAILHRSKAGNVYTFTTNYPIKCTELDDDSTGETKNESPASNRANMALVYFLENILKTKKGTGLRAFSKLMLDYLAEGKTTFSSADFLEQLKIHQTTVNDFLRMLADENLLKVHRKDGTRKIYTLKQKTAVPDTAISENVSNKNTLLTKLQRIISTGGTASRQCAEVLIRFLDSGKMRFSTEDLYKATGWDNRMIHDALRSCKRNQIIRNTSEKKDQL